MKDCIGMTKVMWIYDQNLEKNRWNVKCFCEISKMIHIGPVIFWNLKCYHIMLYMP